jgi:hypothetical protein
VVAGFARKQGPRHRQKIHSTCSMV